MSRQHKHQEPSNGGKHRAGGGKQQSQSDDDEEPVREYGSSSHPSMLSSVQENTPRKPDSRDAPLKVKKRPADASKKGDPKSKQQMLEEFDSEDEETSKKTNHPKPSPKGQEYYTKNMQNLEQTKSQATNLFSTHLKANLRGLIKAAAPSDNSDSDSEGVATKPAKNKQKQLVDAEEGGPTDKDVENPPSVEPLKIEAVIIDGKRVSLSTLTLGQRVQLVSRVNPVLPSKPFLCAVHVLCKVAAVLSYLFGTMLLPQVGAFLLVFGLLVLDFWVNKNITGRKLVGLR